MSNLVALDRDRHTIEKIEALMANPPEGSVVLEITPSGAEQILKRWRGDHNRNVKPNAIRRYADAMKDGEWQINGSTVVFTNRNKLGDGQNRLGACIRAGRAFKTHVVFGVPHEYFYTMDQGRVRNSADVLAIQGVDNAQVIGAAVRWAELLTTGKVTFRTVFSPDAILKLYKEKHKGVADWLDEARAIFRLNRQPVAMVAAFLYWADQADGDFTADFASAWAAGTYEPRFSPIGRMQFAIEKISRSAHGRVHETVRLAMIVQCWNGIHQGRTRFPIEWNPKQKFPALA